MVEVAESRPVSRRLSVGRCAGTGGFVVTALFALCWIGAAAGWVLLSHMYIALFTTAPVGSVAALAEGISFAIGFGALCGALTGLGFNATAFLERS